MTDSDIKHVVIVGGGTAGWMAAAKLAQAFESVPLNITLIESSTIGTVGVGEATIPTIRRFYGGLGFDDDTMLRRTDGTCKLGIEFRGWSREGDSFFHPFSLYGQKSRGIDFHHYWAWLYKQGLAEEIGAYSLGVELARTGKFSPPPSGPSPSYAAFDWALHLDASKFAEVLKRYSRDKGVTHIESTVGAVKVRDSDGNIESLTLSEGNVIFGDLFIDCSGFRGLLIEQALKTGYESWQDWLKCDSAWVVPSEVDSKPTPYTVATAQKAGWQWRIPLRTRTGNGHVYSSQYMSDDEAVSVLTRNLEAAPLSEPRYLSFTPGRRKKAWNKNCIALGLAAGFLEPLESTSIALIETALERLILLFPDRTFQDSLRDEFNEMTQLEYERVRDFVILHYHASQRTDSAFWKDVTREDIPDTLGTKIRAFRERGHLIKYRWEIFQDPSWLSVYAGMRILPERSHPLARQYDLDFLKASFSEIRKSIQQSAENALPHRDFLKSHLS